MELENHMPTNAGMTFHVATVDQLEKKRNVSLKRNIGQIKQQFYEKTQTQEFCF